MFSDHSGINLKINNNNYNKNTILKIPRGQMINKVKQEITMENKKTFSTEW